MKRRYAYVLLFAVPTLLLSVIAAAAAAGLMLGVLWLFVFGDSPWPAWTGGAIAVVAATTAAVLWTAQLAVAQIVGKAQEGRASLPRRHVAVAVGSTLLLILVIVLRLTSGGRGVTTDTVRCGDFCREAGFAASSMPPRDSGDRTCTCYDAQGRPATTTSLGAIDRSRR